jgi:hypothetical protein
MEREDGNKKFPIWLLGDSNPKNWQNALVKPLDWRHPARHNIWTPILEVIQDRVYRKCRARVEMSSVYIRNAIADPGDKPVNNDTSWSLVVQQEVGILGTLIDQYRPTILLTFGAFAFEFARRTQGEEPQKAFGKWTTDNLGQEFESRVAKLKPGNTNVLPLLHTSISRGRFIESHDYFSKRKGGNYFEFAGVALADKLLEYQDQLQIWVE